MQNNQGHDDDIHGFVHIIAVFNFFEKYVTVFKTRFWLENSPEMLPKMFSPVAFASETVDRTP